MADIYGAKLKSVVSQLEGANIVSNVEGEGTSRFVFAKQESRAVEISWAGDDGVFIEFWTGSNEAPSVREETVESFDIAASKAMDWLNVKP